MTSTKSLSLSQACAYLGIDRRTMSRYRAAGTAPDFTTLPGGGHRYTLAELDRWRAVPRAPKRINAKDPANGQFLPKAP